MKGIILAGGAGTRLHPVTRSIVKQLLPIYDKPMLYYPLSALMLAGIRDVLIISTPEDTSRFEDLFADGAHLGMRFSYKIQPSPGGLAQAFLLGEEFIGDDSVCLVLGDNIFYGHGLTELLRTSRAIVETENHAVVFGYYVDDPDRYGVVEFDADGNAVSIEEKPKNPKSNYAVTGLYFYPREVVDVTKKLKPSARGELEITAVNEAFLKKQRLRVLLMGRGYAWLDTGTHDSLLEASMFISTIEKRQGLKVACIEEIAYNMGYIDRSQLLSLAKPLKNTQYGRYLEDIAGKE